MKWKMYTGLFLLFCAWGFFFEWFYGHFWSVVGLCPWVYPNSPLVYTGCEGIPLWGLGGLTTIQLFKVVKERNKRALGYVAILQVLVILWITALSVLA